MLVHMRALNFPPFHTCYAQSTILIINACIIPHMWLQNFQRGNCCKEITEKSQPTLRSFCCDRIRWWAILKSSKTHCLGEQPSGYPFLPLVGFRRVQKLQKPRNVQNAQFCDQMSERRLFMATARKMDVYIPCWQSSGNDRPSCSDCVGNYTGKFQPDRAAWPCWLGVHPLRNLSPTWGARAE